MASAAMRVTSVGSRVPWEERVRSWMAGHPEFWPLAVSLQALLLLIGSGAALGGPICAAIERGGFGMSADWALMSLVMVPWLAIPMVRHVAARSLACRRGRAVAAFMLGAIGPWLLAGVVIAPLLADPASSLSGARPATIVMGWFLAAALWQAGPFKRRALRGCHRMSPLAPFGWRADRDCAAAGLAYGAACVGSCWAMMAAAMAAPASLAAMAGVTVVAVYERRPDAAPGRSALALLLCAGFGVPS